MLFKYLHISNKSAIYRGIEKEITTFRTGSPTRIKNGGRSYEN